jgi:hypothetical protein
LRDFFEGPKYKQHELWSSAGENRRDERPEGPELAGEAVARASPRPCAPSPRGRGSYNHIEAPRDLVGAAQVKAAVMKDP